MDMRPYAANDAVGMRPPRLATHRIMRPFDTGMPGSFVAAFHRSEVQAVAQIERRLRRERVRPGWRWLAIALLVPALLAGCTDLDEPPVVPPTLPASPGASLLPRTPTATPEPTISAPVVSPLPSPQRIYFTHGGDLWQLPLDNLAAPVISGSNLLAFAPSPDGERVAVALQENTGEPGQRAEEFAIVNADSTVALQLSTPDDAFSDPEGVQAIAWSPNGEALALAAQDGALAIVGTDGSVQLLLPPHAESAPGALQWSPDGQTLSYLDPLRPGEATALSTVSVVDGERRLLVEGSEQAAVHAAVWLPGRHQIAYVLGSPSRVENGGDLFAISPDEGTPMLLVSAGNFAPVAGVVAVAASQSGRYLAFTVFVPGPERPDFQSLWVMELSTREMTEVPVARGQSVTDLWWAGEQLIYRQIDESQVVVPAAYTGTEPFALVQYDPATGASDERYRS